MVNLKEIAEKLAPKISEALSGPLQGQAMAMVLKRLKVDTLEQAETKLNADPNAIKELRGAEQDFAAAISTAPSTAPRKDIAIVTIAILYNIGYFTLLIFFIKTTFGTVLVLDEWAKGMIGLLVGVLTGQLPTINSYFFGTTAGSARKTEAITNQLNKG